VTSLIFDCDGVLADTERYGHLPAFNAMFDEFGLPVHWSEDEYGRLLKIGGGTGLVDAPAEVAIRVF
jgi:beta-phosphoglucomutase-like phosphatase (HAD superfamily)